MSKFLYLLYGALIVVVATFVNLAYSDSSYHSSGSSSRGGGYYSGGGGGFSGGHK